MSVPPSLETSNETNKKSAVEDSICKIELKRYLTNPHYLKQCFFALHKRQELMVPPEVLKIILKTTFSIQFEELDETLQNVLLDMLQYLMIVWPLWPCVHETVDKTEVNQYYTIFLSYMRQHITDVIDNEKMYRTQGVDKVDKSTDTNDLSKKLVDAPFTIVIEGPAHLQSSVVFSNKGNDDDLTLFCYKLQGFPKLSLDQLLNWPYVSIQIDFLDIAFSRRNVYELKSFLCSYTEISSDSNDAKSQRTYVVKPSGEPRVIHFEYLRYYLSELWRNIDARANPKLAQILFKVFHHFLSDIEEANLSSCGVTVGSSVIFNIGGQRYIRNRTVVTSDKSDTNSPVQNKKAYINEELIPKVEIVLEKLSEHKKLPDKSRIHSSNCFIAFHCQFCNVIFGGLNAWDMLQDHMERLHINEYAFYCSKCKASFEATKLAQSRWKHECS